MAGARSQSTDFLHSMRFHVSIDDDPLKSDGTPQAGFSAVSTPEATVEAVEYKEGHTIYTKKYPGNTTVTDVTLSRGVTRGDSTFWNWLLLCIEGGDYRKNMTIKHLHRDKSLAGPEAGSLNRLAQNTDNPARIYHLYEAFPIRHKVAADMDATSSEISIMELDVAFEHFDITEGTP